MTTDPILPVVQGDWVASLPNRTFQVGRVRGAHYDKGEVFIDLILFDASGVQVGRVSPHMGGPKSFEPWVQYTGNFRRIAKPDFPLTRKSYSIPTKKKKNGNVMHRVHFDYDLSVIIKPERTKTVKRGQPRWMTRIAPTSLPKSRMNINMDGEISALRRAAQELRDMAKKIAASEVGRRTMLDRATELEKEAAALAS